MKRILLYSNRNIYEKKVYRCILHEFEDVINSIDEVDLVAPTLKWQDKIYRGHRKFAQYALEYFNLNFNPGIPTIKINDYYDLFFYVCDFPQELIHLNAIKGIKKFCKKSMCFINEFWIEDICKYEFLIELLQDFDCVFIGLSTSIDALEKKFRSKIRLMYIGIDNLKFFPAPNTTRDIYIYSIGRRDENYHKNLKRFCKEKNALYIYDTLSNYLTNDLVDHRAAYANMLKHSNYFVVSPGKFNYYINNSKCEIGSRYFEGSAAGAILIGEKPINSQNETIFCSENFVEYLPNDYEELKNSIYELDQNLEKKIKIRRNNIINSLKVNDWLYRWEKVLAEAGLKPIDKFYKRKEKLSKLVELSEIEEII